MPGPGKRGKATKSSRPKTQSSIVSSEADQVYVTEIDNAESWDIIANILCQCFDLPDLSTRSGLKKVHANFSTIYSRVDSFYQRNSGNVKIRGAIVGIYAKMCIDAILRDKLFDKGVLDKIMPLCQIDDTRHIALQALTTITHHGGASVRIEIAKHANVLAKLLRDLPDDEKVAELVVSILAHAISAVAGGDVHPGDSAVLKQIDIAAVFKSVLEAVKRPYAHPRVMINHAVELVATSSMHGCAAMAEYPQSIGFLVAGLRSKGWPVRSSCLAALIRLHQLEAEEDNRNINPQRMMAVIEQQLTPDLLIDVLWEYGQSRTEIYVMMACMSEYQKAMMECLQDQNLHKLGLTLGKLIVKTEYSIGDGYFQTEDGLTGRRSTAKTSLPFTRWRDALPLCAAAIRRAGRPEEQDFADILDIKHYIMNRRVRDGVTIAKKAIERNPEQSYFYYALTLAADHVQGLSAAKKGMKCKLLTPFIKYQLMQRAMEHAGWLGIKILQEQPPNGDKKWEEGIAFLMSALEDAKAYIEGAPPDNLHMKTACYWYIILYMTTTEDLSPDLQGDPELKDIFYTLKHSEGFSVLYGAPPSMTNMRLALGSIVKNYSSGLKDFNRVFETYDNIEHRSDAPVVNPDKIEDDLAKWLANMQLEDGNLEDYISCNGPNKKGIKVDYKDVSLYRCTWCGNPSAILRKCGGCGETRYCDAACQKAHWATHKKQCKK